MATAAQWLEGARPRTLPVAVSPVLAGTGVAAFDSELSLGKALLALVVAVALQVAVNYANDYSDGIRGTDDDRIGPLRLVGSGAASPREVRAAAALAVAVACVAGIVLAATTSWALLAVGAIAVLAAWFYTGGPRPYGYVGLGEVSVFLFFGLVAVAGTTYVQTEQVSTGALLLGAGLGGLACAVLVANNLRDVFGDTAVGKRTLAVRLGDSRSRILFAALHGAAYVCLVLASYVLSPWVLLGLVSLPLSLRAQSLVRRGVLGLGLIPVLRDTSLTELAYAAGALAGLLVASSS